MIVLYAVSVFANSVVGIDFSKKHFSDNNPSLLHMDKYVIVIVVNVISNHI